jgi:hypothetical protein
MLADSRQIGIKLPIKSGRNIRPGLQAHDFAQFFSADSTARNLISNDG